MIRATRRSTHVWCSAASGPGSAAPPAPAAGRARGCGRPGAHARAEGQKVEGRGVARRVQLWKFVTYDDAGT